MKKISRIMLLGALLTGQMFTSFADRGVGKKKTKITLNIPASPASSLSSSLNFNLRNSMKYTGSLIHTTVSANTLISGTQTTLITYQQGNSVYIMPYKQTVIVPADARQGYAGTKLIIRVP